MSTLSEYYDKYIRPKQNQVADSPFDDPRTAEEIEAETTPYTGCSNTCIHPHCPLWDNEHSKRLFSIQ